MTREVLPARLSARFVALASIALSIGTLVGCCTAAHLADLPDRPYVAAPQAVPMAVWTVDFEARCEADWFQPATFCGRRVLDFDGCEWSCVEPPIDGARQ